MHASSLKARPFSFAWQRSPKREKPALSFVRPSLSSFLLFRREQIWGPPMYIYFGKEERLHSLWAHSDPYKYRDEIDSSMVHSLKTRWLRIPFALLFLSYLMPTRGDVDAILARLHRMSTERSECVLDHAQQTSNIACRHHRESRLKRSHENVHTFYAL